MKQRVTMTVPEFAQVMLDTKTNGDTLDKEKYEWVLHVCGTPLGTSEMGSISIPEEVKQSMRPYLYLRRMLDILFLHCIDEDNETYHGSNYNHTVTFESVYKYSALIPLVFTSDNVDVEFFRSGECGFIIAAAINGKVFIELSSAIGTLIPVSQLSVGNSEVTSLILRHADEVVLSELFYLHGLGDVAESTLLRINEQAIRYERFRKGGGE